MATGSSQQGGPSRKGESKHEPISLLDDDEDNTVSNFMPRGYAGAETIIRHDKQQRRAFDDLIPLDQDDDVLSDEVQSIVDADEAALNEEINRIEIDLTQDDDNNGSQPAGRARRLFGANRTCPLPVSTHRSVEAYTTNGFQVEVNDFIELVQAVGEWHIQFIEIKQIWVNNTSFKATIRGMPYTRNRYLAGRLQCKRNEVCQVSEIDCDDASPVNEQAMMEIDPEQILARRTCNKTNASFPNFQFGDDATREYGSVKEKEERAALTCRWKLRVEYRNARFRKACKSYAAAFVHLTEDDVEDPRYRVSDNGRLEDWRGAPVLVTPGHRYTFADTFCGAGGATRGATMERFEVCLVA